MKVVHIETLISAGDFANSAEWLQIREQAVSAVKSVDWPPGSGAFTIHPTSGKKRGEGNGVKPIKNSAIAYLLAHGWRNEYPWPAGVGDRIRPGNMDAAHIGPSGIVAFEWETGNVSSSHRSLNKMALGLFKSQIIAGLLVVPSRKLYVYLTDRIGNYSELQPYFSLWSATPCERGVLEIIVIEQDGESLSVPRIPKGTDGRSAL